jgi:hypothetical protein
MDKKDIKRIKKLINKLNNGIEAHKVNWKHFSQIRLQMENAIKEKEVIIGVLEKQIPVKPEIRERTKYLDGEPYDIVVCKKCGALFIDNIEWEDLYDDEKLEKVSKKIETSEFVYCPKCGQRLDWN